MADLCPYLANRKLTLNPAAFVDIVAPIDCNNFSVTLPGVAFTLRSDPGDSNTEKTITPSGQDTYVAPMGEVTPGFPRFPRGTHICSIKPSAGTGPAIIGFLT